MGLAIGQIIGGFIEAFFGRKIFWIFVALAGFSVGWALASWIAGGLATWLWVLIGAVVGIVFALLSLKFTRAMVAISGFFAFGFVTVQVVRWLGATAANGSATYWVAYAIGGLIGAFLMGVLFNWALIVLTALVGGGAAATGITHFVSNGPKWLQVVLWVVLFGLGALYQARSLRGGRARAKGR